VSSVPAGGKATRLLRHSRTCSRGETARYRAWPCDISRSIFGVCWGSMTVSPGYEQIRVRMDVQADCSDEELNALLAYTQEHSPVCQTVCRPVPVHVERVARAAQSRTDTATR
jgi:hypothetical protein